MFEISNVFYDLVNRLLCIHKMNVVKNKTTY